jgi:hypothetical protein
MPQTLSRDLSFSIGYHFYALLILLKLVALHLHIEDSSASLTISDVGQAWSEHTDLSCAEILCELLLLPMFTDTSQAPDRIVPLG